MNSRNLLGWGACLLVLGAQALSGAPLISDFNSKAGTPGDQVTLTGSGFTTPGMIVKFWPDQTVTGGSLQSDSIVIVVVPPGTATGRIRIETSTATNYSTVNFLAIGSGPYIFAATNAADGTTLGSVGDSVIVSGVHLTNLLSLKFAGTVAAGSPSSDGLLISTHIPSGATSGPVSVTTLFGGPTNSPSSFTVIGNGPYISGFSPAVGDSGTTVNISGTHFGDVTTVRFNGLGVPITPTSYTLLSLKPPAGVTSGPISVEAPSGPNAGTNTTATNFFAPPTITGISPGAGRAGTNVLITGTSFLGTTLVEFNSPGLICTNFTVLNNTSIRAPVPVGATNGPIWVTAPAGSVPSTKFTVLPLITGFSPAFGPVGTAVTISGANLNIGTPTVRFHDVAATILSNVSFGQLTAVVPPGATTGPLSVTTSDGSYTNTSNFYLPPRITGFTPTNSAPGTRVTVTGTNFTDVSVVAFNGAPVTSFNVTNNNTLGVTVPTSVTTGFISITTPAGTTNSPGLFYGAPVITNFTPTHGLPGTVLTLNGTNFRGASLVLFNGANVPVNANDNGQLQVTVPPGILTGPVSIVAPAGTNTTANSFVLDYTSDLTVSITDAPDPVPLSSNLVYTIVVLNNHGPFTADNVRLTNTLPAGVQLIAATTTQGTLNTNANPILANLGSLPVGNAVTVTLTALPAPAEALVDSVSVGSDYPDPAPFDNSMVAFTTVLPLLSIKALSGDRISLSWNANFNHFVLDSKNSLATGVYWSNVTLTPVLSGTNAVVTDTNLGGTRFYRLRK